MAYLQRVGCIQYDPLDMVGTNPNLVLQSRIAGYSSALLTQLLYHDRILIEGWDKNMAIWPIQDWPYFRRYRERDLARLYERPDIVQALPQVRGAITQKGPLTSAEVDLPDKVRWAWAPTQVGRAALESLYFTGELVIHHRKGTRKYYDFAKKHLPLELLDAPEPNATQAEYLAWHIMRRLGGVGLLWNRSGDAWLGIMGLDSQTRASTLQALEAKGQLMALEVVDIPYRFYIRRGDYPLLEEVMNQDLPLSQAGFLAPLDNLLWDRKLVQALFAFDYTWEVYKPAALRQYGYYVLPVLYGDRFVARFEPRWEQGVLKILGWWWEANTEVTPGLKAALAQALEEFCSYLQAQEIDFGPLSL